MFVGTPMLNGINDEIVKCDAQTVNGFVYYASFPEGNSMYVTQAKFLQSNSGELTLECSLAGQSYEDNWNLDC